MPAHKDSFLLLSHFGLFLGVIVREDVFLLLLGKQIIGLFDQWLLLFFLFEMRLFLDGLGVMLFAERWVDVLGPRLVQIRFSLILLLRLHPE